jgi:hypothetical protein
LDGKLINVDEMPLWNGRKGLSEQHLDNCKEDINIKIHSVLFTDEFLRKQPKAFEKCETAKWEPNIYSQTDVEAIDRFLVVFFN